MGFLDRIAQSSRAKVNMRNKALGKQFEGEPVWQKIEKLMTVLAEWYNVNHWIMLDKEAMAVLENDRKEFEEAEDTILKLVNKQREEAHEEIETKFGRMHDKKKLELQLKSMQREYHTLRKLAKLKGHGKLTIEFNKAKK